MKDQEKLCRLMLFQSKKIEGIVGGEKYSRLYLNNDDLHVLLSWNDETAKWVWKDVVHSIMNVGSGLDRFVFPFCVRYQDCEECEYAIRHGFCYDSTSDRSKTLLWLGSLGSGIGKRLLDNSFYREVLRVIERGNEYNIYLDGPFEVIR